MTSRADTLLKEPLYEEQLRPVCSPALLAARGRPHVPNDRLRHMLIGYARVSKANGSQPLAEFERELIRERTLAGLKAARTQRRQDVRAVESPGATGPGRDGAPRHLRVRALT